MGEAVARDRTEEGEAVGAEKMGLVDTVAWKRQTSRHETKFVPLRDL